LTGVSAKSTVPPVKILKRILVGLLVLFVLIQFVPAERSNPPVTEDVDAPAEVKAVLRRACYDCHSHETRYPWYTRIAPVKFLIAHDVEEGREHLNFSTWDAYSEEDRDHAREEVWEEVEEGEMPLWFYVPLHSEAKLTDADLAVLRAWPGAPEASDATDGD